MRTLLTMPLLLRIPIRWRLTLAFSIGMTAVVGSLGYFLAEQLEANLSRAIDQGLVRLADQIAVEGPEEQIGSAQAAARGRGDIAQILSTDGRVLASTPGINRPILGRTLIRSIGSARRYLIAPPTRPGAGPTRVLAYRTTFRGRPIVVVAGSSLRPLRDARDQLVRSLLVGGPLALVLSCLLGYAVAASALRPVERMRRQAAAVTADDARRLHLPPARDELRGLATTLNEMLDRLQAALQRERAFTMDASHELRTPLSILKAELELALRPKRTREEHVAALRSAEEEVERLTRLADDLLVLARTEARGLPVRRAAIDLDALLVRVAGRFADVARTRGVEVSTHTDFRGVFVADQDRLEQAMTNLLSNAVHYAVTAVTVSGESDGDAVTLTVADDGPGFPPAFLPRAFERFAQADASRNSAGAGLGLAIVRAVADAHGGSAHAENGDAGGARVRLVLPKHTEA